MVQLTFKDYITEGQVEHQHIKRMMDAIAPEKRNSARKAYHHAKTVKKLPHAASLNAMRVYAENVEQFDTLLEVVVVSAFPTIQKAIKDSHTPPKGTGGQDDEEAVAKKLHGKAGEWSKEKEDFRKKIRDLDI